MARGINKLSARSVAAAKEIGLYGDGGNLYLQVADVDGTGITKAWLFRFMLAGRARKMGLGSVNDFTLAEARERARQARQKVADGIDPIEARLAARDSLRKDEAENIIFKDAAAKYLAVHETGWKNAKHRQQWRNTLKAYAYPTLGGRPVKAIDTALVNGCVAPIWTTIPETASRVRQRIESVVQWVKDGMPLPASGKTRQKRPHPALPVEEMPAFMAALRDHDSISARALEFTILTAARTGAVIGATRPEVDFESKVWTVPMTRAGTKLANRDHRVPLPDRAIEILKALPQEKDNPHLFIGGKAGAGLSDMAMNELIKGMHEAKVEADGRGWVDPKQNGRRVVPHGVARSSFKDWAVSEAHFPDMLSEFALAHVDKDKVRAAYLRNDLLARRVKLMRDWAAYCSRPPVAGDNVTSLKLAS